MWIEEPDHCIHCKSKESMEFRQVTVDGINAEGWICNDCGWFHLHSKMAYAKIAYQDKN